MGIFGDILSFTGGLIGSNKAANTQKDINYENAALSREYATTGIQWRVADAKKAGLHPLAAMGLPLASAPTLSAGNTDYAASYADMGQSIGRAADSVRTRSERQAVAARDALSLERAGLENELLRTQITNAQRASNPPLPSLGSGTGSSQLLPGQADSYPPAEPYVETKAASPIAMGSPGREAGLISDIGYYQRHDGNIGITKSKDMKERTEDDILAQIGWFLRNNALPALGANVPPPPNPRDYPPPSGKIWAWDPHIMAYKPVKPNSLRGRAQQYKLQRERR